MSTSCDLCGGRSDGFICKGCGGELERAIGDMTSLLHEVSVVATGQARVYRASGQASTGDEEREWDGEQAEIPAWLRSREGRVALPATRLMVRLDARELLWEAGNTLSGWARHLAESRGAELPPAADLIPWLLRNIASIRFDEAAAECHEEITYLHGRMTRAVDRSPSRVYAGPCHAPTADGRCERSLYGWPGADEIECDGHGTGSEYDVGCRAVHTTADRRAWLMAELSDMLMPLTFWEWWLPKLITELEWPNRSTWWRWEKRLEVKGQDSASGEDTFRGGDVVAYAEREQARIIGNRDRTRRSA